MSDGANYDHFMREVSVCVSKKNSEANLYDKLKDADIKNLHRMDPREDPNLKDYRESSNQMEDRLRA